MKSVVHTQSYQVAIPRPSLPIRLVQWLLEADRLYRHRAALEHVSDAQLSDIGLTRTELDAQRRAIRPLADAWAAVQNGKVRV
ncbi:MAG: hypothetical protein AAFR17_13240 [Pseudomonadota bacterium]